MNNGRWTHDLYEARGNNGMAPRDRFFYSRNFRGKNTSGKIPFRTKAKRLSSPSPKYEVLVTNLHWNVTANDIIQLASAVGGFRSVRMDSDESGRFTGRCTVRFNSLESALLAAAKYNGRELDKRPMQWTLVPDSVPSNTSSGKTTIFDRLGKRPEERLGPRYKEAANQNENNQNIKVAKENKQYSFRNRNKNYTSMELDAEIEEYMNNGSTIMNHNNTSSQCLLRRSPHLGRSQSTTSSRQRQILNYEEGSVPVPVLM